MKKFYVFQFQHRNIDLMLDFKPQYDRGKLISGSADVTEPIILSKSQGYYKNDIIRLQCTFNFVISEKIYQGLKENDISGWQTYPVKFEKKEKYFGFQVNGKSGSPDRSIKNKFITGFKFDHSTWDGSDFFIPETTKSIVVTERLKIILERYNIRNIKFTDITEFNWYST